MRELNQILSDITVEAEKLSALDGAMTELRRERVRTNDIMF